MATEDLEDFFVRHFKVQGIQARKTVLQQRFYEIEKLLAQPKNYHHEFYKVHVTLNPLCVKKFEKVEHL